MRNNLTSVIALDVGGSSVKSGLVKSKGSIYFVSNTPINSQASKEDVLQVFIKIIQRYLHKGDGGHGLWMTAGHFWILVVKLPDSIWAERSII